MANQQHSRLGQVLLAKGLITDTQLNAAIQLQAGSGKRLGEILIEQGHLSSRQLARSLSRQNRLRLAAALAAALLAPFQPILAAQRPIADHSQGLATGLQPLSEQQMRAISAQGLDDLPLQLLHAESGHGTPVAQRLSKLLRPILDSLEAETSVHDIRYDTEQLSSTLNADGSLNVRLPSSIGELRFDNIRVTGAPRSQSLGSLSLHDIDLSRASLKIKFHP